MSATASIQENIDELVEDLNDLEDWQEKFRYIIDLAADLEPLGQEYHTREYLVEGCTSQVWLRASLEDGKVIFEGDSDAVIVKGLVAMMIGVYSGHTPEEILETSADFLVDSGITRNLSPNRSNGLASLVKQMKVYALAFQQKQEAETM